MSTVRKILEQKADFSVYSVVPQQSILSAAQLMKAHNIGAAPVMKDGKLIGMISERDILNQVTGPGIDPRDLTVSQVMSDTITTISPDETWDDCLIKMGAAHCRHLPVMEQGEVLGIVSLRDILAIDQAKCLDTYLWDATARV